MKPSVLACLFASSLVTLLVGPTLASAQDGGGSPAVDDPVPAEGGAADDSPADVDPGPAEEPVEAPPPEPSEPPPSERASPPSSPTTDPDRAAPATGPTNLVINVHDDDDDEEAEVEPEPSPFDPHERQGDERYYFGAFVRGIFVPQFIENIFVEGGANRLNPGAGLFFNYRKDGFNILAEVWWASFYAQAPFHGINETDFETEWLESELSTVLVNFAFMWSIPIASFLAIELGFGLGFGGVFGNLWRTEAYPDASSSAGWSPCADVGSAPANPGSGADYCDADVASGGEGSYQRRDGVAEPYNFSGGVPPIWFWVDLPRVAVRINPIRQLQLRVDAGFALYAFHFGGSLAIGF
jgi:hypothetical protein